MKLVFLMCLEDDEAVVLRLLEAHHVAVHSRLPVEGHGDGLQGWTGEVAPYRSRLLFTVVPADRAAALLEAVSRLDTVSDEGHPVHAWQVDVEAATASVGGGGR